MYYRMNIAGLDRDLPICKVTDDLYIAGFVIFGDQELTVACAKALLEQAPAYDYLITAEAKGIPLAHEMARQAGDKKYLLARKAPKLYMKDIIEYKVHSPCSRNGTAGGGQKVPAGTESPQAVYDGYFGI